MSKLKQTTERLEYYINTLTVLKSLRQDCDYLMKSHGNLQCLSTGSIHSLYQAIDEGNIVLGNTHALKMLLQELVDTVWTLIKHPKEKVDKAFDNAINCCVANAEVLLAQLKVWIGTCELDLKNK